MKRSHLIAAVIAGVLGASSGCMVSAIKNGPDLNIKERWILLPLVNYSQSPQADQRAGAILETLLRVRGVNNLQRMPSLADEEGLPELNERRQLDKAIEWAKKERFDYGVTGSVEEWRYRGLDGQPVAGITVQVIALKSGRVVFSASGSRSGWGRETVSGTAQKLMEKLLDHLKLK